MNVFIEMLKAALALAAILTVWIAVQHGWRRAFPDAVPDDEDVLQGRLGCHACSCTEPCERRKTNSTSED